MKKKNSVSIGSFLQGFRHAARGICTLFREEFNARFHLGAFILVLILGVWLKISSLEWILVLILSGAVLTAEAMNSAIERLADRITTEHDQLIGKAKDLAAGGVLLTAIIAALVGAIIFLPKIYALFL